MINSLNTKLDSYNQDDETSLDNKLTASSSSAVISVDKNNNYLVRCANGQLKVAKKSFSCLIKPQKDDIVVLSKVENDNYITAILERLDDKSATNIELPNNTNISCDGDLSLEANKLKQTALVYENCANEMLNIAKYIKSFSQESYRHTKIDKKISSKVLKEVKEFEQNIIKNYRLLVKDNYLIDAKRVNMSSEEDTKIKAKTILMS